MKYYFFTHFDRKMIMYAVCQKPKYKIMRLKNYLVYAIVIKIFRN